MRSWERGSARGPAYTGARSDSCVPRATAPRTSVGCRRSSGCSEGYIGATLVPVRVFGALNQPISGDMAAVPSGTVLFRWKSIRAGTHIPRASLVASVIRFPPDLFQLV